MNVPIRRLKRVRISPRELLQVINWAKGLPRFLRVPVIQDLPEGCEVLSVHEDWNTRTIVLIVCHESFDEVPDGDVVPEFCPGISPIEWKEIEYVLPPIPSAESLMATCVDNDSSAELDEQPWRDRRYDLPPRSLFI